MFDQQTLDPSTIPKKLFLKKKKKNTSSDFLKHMISYTLQICLVPLNYKTTHRFPGQPFPQPEEYTRSTFIALKSLDGRKRVFVALPVESAAPALSLDFGDEEDPEDLEDLQEK